MPLSVGEKLGPYEILGQIGAGGMGEVWKARDTRLDRVVAVKRLGAEHIARFQQEARAIAALNHANICQIHDLGPDYLVMEFVDGEPLVGPIAADQAVRLAIQIAAALEEAHSHRILHRDLKPGNILVTRKGVAKLLDFGLAKSMNDANMDATKTMDGMVVGTAAYMSPEQAQGQPLDERSDIFSFGAVLYELLSGERAFAGETMAQVLTAVLRDNPRPLRAPSGIDTIVKRCLAKRPAERFSSATELLAALEQKIAVKPKEEKPSIAVLAFANISRDDDEYFSDGLAEEILNLLTHVPGLKVIARTSSFAFKGKNEDIRKIGEVLGVRTILEGSVRRSGNRIRVTAQLISAEDGSNLWSQRYDREMTDVFVLQDEIASGIAAALKLKFTVKGRHTPSLAAHEAYLRGRSLESGFTVEGLCLARKYYEQAIALDPDYADPHAGLSAYYVLMNTLGAISPQEAAPRGRAACERALEIDPSNSLAHASLAVFARAYDLDWGSAERHLEFALDAPAVPAFVHYLAALHHYCLGRFPEAIREMEWCVEEDPLSGLYHAIFALILVSAGAIERAYSEVHRALEIDPNFWLAHGVFAWIHVAAGKTQEAIQANGDAVRLAPWPVAMGARAGLLYETGDTQGAEEMIERLRQMPAHSVPLGMLFYHLVRKELSAAAECYEKLIEFRHPQVTLSIYDPWMAPLRASSHWLRVARLLNLPGSAASHTQ
jgi:eukaryotic-like serine/threonine-protein kinase